MKNGRVIIINGTSSFGKTNIVHAIQDLLQDPYLEAWIDKFIWMMPKRYLVNSLWDEVLGQAGRTGTAGHDLVRGMHRAIEALSKTGCNVIADHVLVEPAWGKDCAVLFADLPAYLIGVQCPLEVLEHRRAPAKTASWGRGGSNSRSPINRLSTTSKWIPPCSARKNTPVESSPG